MSAATVSPLSQRTASMVWLCAVGGLLLLLFGESLWGLGRYWSNDPNYSHGFLVLPLSVVMAVGYVRRTGVPAEGDARLGSLNVLAGCLLHLAAVVFGSPPLDFLALALLLRGLAVTAGGRAWARGLTFPILFLFFMFPLPFTWTSYAAIWLQEWVSRISAATLDLFVVCYRRGTSLYVAGVDGPLVVARECSGLRQIVAFLALGALLGQFAGRGWGFRLVLLAAAVPVAILANVVRVLLMAFGAYLFGTGWIDGWLHHAPVLFSLPLGLALYLLTFWCLGRLWPGRGKGGAP